MHRRLLAWTQALCPALPLFRSRHAVGVLARRDGIVVQALDGGDMKGYGDADETPDRAESERALAATAPMFARPAGFRPG